jgi:hypothetical protein
MNILSLLLILVGAFVAIAGALSTSVLGIAAGVILIILGLWLKGQPIP